MLNLEKVEREILASVGAFAKDDAGNEVLRGLTVEESQFVLNVERWPYNYMDSNNTARYLQLKNRHVQARMVTSRSGPT